MQLHEELQRNTGRQLFLVPTTEVTIGFIPKWLLSKSCPTIIVGKVWRQHLQRPNIQKLNEFLKLLKGGAEYDPLAVIVFSDQLTSVADAPILTEIKGRLVFVSALEVIAHCNYQLEIRAWTGAEFESSQGPSKPEAIFRLLSKYFTACECLGHL